MTDVARSDPAEGSPLKGILLVVLATLSFAAADVLTKDLATRFPVPVAMAGRYLVTMALLAAIFYPRVGSGLWRVKRSGLVITRSICLALASLTFALALRMIPVAEAVAIVYLAPFAVMLLAIPILGEKVSTWGWCFAFVGFGGVLLILRPGGGLNALGVSFALMDAILTTAYHLLTRKLAGAESTAALMFHAALIGSIFFVVTSLGSLPGLTIGVADLAAMAGLGVLATLGHFSFTAAFREAPASTLAPVNYLHLVWAGLLGWAAFGQLPDAISLGGMALVCLAGVAIASRAGRRTRPVIREEPTPRAP